MQGENVMSNPITLNAKTAGDLAKTVLWVASAADKKDPREFARYLHVKAPYILATDGKRLHRAIAPDIIDHVPSGAYAFVRMRGRIDLSEAPLSGKAPDRAWRMLDGCESWPTTDWKKSEDPWQSCSMLIAALGVLHAPKEYRTPLYGFNPVYLSTAMEGANEVAALSPDLDMLYLSDATKEHQAFIMAFRA